MDNFKLKKEDRTLTLIRSKERPKTIRQNRLTSDVNLLKVLINNTEFNVFNYSKFGVAIKTSNVDFFKSGKRINLQIRVDESIVYNEKAEMTHLRAIDEYYVIGCKLSHFLELDEIQALLAMQKLFRKSEGSIEKRKKLDHQFVKEIDEFHYYLKTVKKEVDSIEKNIETLDYEVRTKYLQKFKENFNEKFKKFLKNVNDEFCKFQSHPDMDEKSFYLKYAQDMVTPYFAKVGIGKRAVTKPLGYAGDYEMMNQIYRKKIDSGTLFDNLMNSALVESRCGESVRYRRELLAGIFSERYKSLPKQEKIKSLSVACGPAKEIQDFVDREDKHMINKFEFDLLDLDKFALKYAQSKIYEKMIKKDTFAPLRLINHNVIHLAMGKIESLPINEYDLIYSAGLYDYLDVKLSKLLTRELFKSLKPGGRLIIGNFSSKNPEKVFLDLMLDWFLLHKSDDEMKVIAPEGAEVKLQHDPNNVIVYMTIIKKE